MFFDRYETHIQAFGDFCVSQLMFLFDRLRLFMICSCYHFKVPNFDFPNSKDSAISNVQSSKSSKCSKWKFWTFWFFWSPIKIANERKASNHKEQWSPGQVFSQGCVRPDPSESRPRILNILNFCRLILNMLNFFFEHFELLPPDFEHFELLPPQMKKVQNVQKNIQNV